jgi:hypothetical protein
MTARARTAVLLLSLPASSCERAPSFDILGSYFPAWLLCLCVSLLLTVLVRWALLRLQVAVVAPVLVYPCLLAALTCAQWLLFLR